LPNRNLSELTVLLSDASVDKSLAENANRKYKTRRSRVRRPCPTFASVRYVNLLTYIRV